MPVSEYFGTTFAQAGSLTPVPDAPQGNGSVSYNQGFGVLYSTPVAQGGLNVPRAQTNQIFNDITTAVQNWQQNTIAPFITTTMNGGSAYSYPEYALVLYEGVAYQSNTGSNTDTPPSSKWNVANIGSGNTFIGSTTTGSANAQVLASLTPSGFALEDGYSIRFTAGYTNTTATTLAITSPSISATAIYKNSAAGLVPLTGGEIVTNNEIVVIYNATAGYFVLQGGISEIPNIQKFTTSGTYTPSAGMLYCIAEMWGGGGGGGGADAQYAGAGGGGAGGYSKAVIKAATIGASQTITIGAGGTAGANTGGTGGTGGTTSLGSILTVAGGLGGVGGISPSATILGGVGGAGTVNGVTTQGAPGQYGNTFQNGSGGAGGSTSLGGGAVAVIGFSTAAAGNAGTTNSGGGGGGAVSAASATAEAGGVGGSGVMIITEYFQ